MQTALDRRVAYFGAQLSENIASTPEGFLICKNAVIGRTGFQIYKVAELADPERIIGARYQPHDNLEIWRDPDEVFAPATVASFEGKPFTLTHPDELLNPDNTNLHIRGHVQNVRRGDESLESGDWPLLADIIVQDREAIRAIETGSRELSCGYTYRLAKEGHRFEQREILGNHVALVQRGRAGAEARINDSVPSEVITPKETSVIIKNPLRHILTLGMQIFAKDAKPEDLTEVLQDTQIATAMGATPAPARAVATDGAGAGDNTNVITLKKDDAREVIHEGKKLVSIGKTSDGVELFKQVANDAAALTDDEKRKVEEGRKVLHQRLDLVLDAAEKNRGKAADADIEKLAADIDKYMALDEKEKEEGADAHPKGCRCDDCKDKAKDAETEKELIGGDKEEEEEEETKDAEILRSEPVLGATEVPKNALTADGLRVIVADASLQTLRLLKPFIAKSGDKKLIGAFDTAYKKFRKIIKDEGAGGAGSYVEFTRAAASPSAAARDSAKFSPRESEAEKTCRANDKIYADAMSERSKLSQHITGRPN